MWVKLHWQPIDGASWWMEQRVDTIPLHGKQRLDTIPFYTDGVAQGQSAAAWEDALVRDWGHRALVGLQLCNCSFAPIRNLRP